MVRGHYINILQGQPVRDDPGLKVCPRALEQEFQPHLRPTNHKYKGSSFPSKWMITAAATEMYISRSSERENIARLAPRIARSRSRTRRDVSYERQRPYENRVVEEHINAVRWAYIVGVRRDVRGQVLLGRIADIGPPQRREPTTRTLESVIVSMRDTESGQLIKKQKPPSSRKLTVIPFRVFKGKVISGTGWERPYNRDWTDGDFARIRRTRGQAPGLGYIHPGLSLQGPSHNQSVHVSSPQSIE
ncbi:hypothetical protein BDV96DRAFT_592988 [Lophiotrema nucula]|uniref:Uncharacterized protein n=1 Tax=Lophiotrema nucula TaxID=690887 RepID=A0A6A5ZRV9_9PLEO|nr:hypothetical protein BDV96DRAFT_592988 [Lophiotrema nucula]